MKYVYHMQEPKGALLFLQDLHSDLVEFIGESGVLFLMDDKGKTDWYVFLVSAENLTPKDASLIGSILAGRGEISRYSLDELSNHPNKAFMSSGSFAQIMTSLDALGETRREIRAKIQLN